MSLALLITGANGQLGTDLRHAVREGTDVFARGLTRKDLDVTDAFGVQDMVLGWSRIVRSDNPDHRLVVVNATAYTAVDAAESDEETARLVALERDGSTEIVIHVNKLKEGWDVTNLYTIVPLRAANARTPRPPASPW